MNITNFAVNYGGNASNISYTSPPQDNLPALAGYIVGCIGMMAVVRYIQRSQPLSPAEFQRLRLRRSPINLSSDVEARQTTVPVVEEQKQSGNLHVFAESSVTMPQEVDIGLSLTSTDVRDTAGKVRKITLQHPESLHAIHLESISSVHCETSLRQSHLAQSSDSPELSQPLLNAIEEGGRMIPVASNSTQYTALVVAESFC